VNYKCAAFDKSASGNVIMESCAAGGGDDVLPEIDNYTSTCKFDAPD
jgi:hypothetical protein